MAATDTTEGKGLLEATEPPETVDGTVYVVQVLEERQWENDERTTGGVEEVWRDIGTVTLPARSRRKRAVEEVLSRPQNSGLRPTGDITRKFRALDTDSAEEIPAGVRVHEELVVG